MTGAVLGAVGANVGAVVGDAFGLGVAVTVAVGAGFDDEPPPLQALKSTPAVTMTASDLWLDTKMLFVVVLHVARNFRRRDGAGFEIRNHAERTTGKRLRRRQQEVERREDRRRGSVARV